jgi:hypothetical protein
MTVAKAFRPLRSAADLSRRALLWMDLDLALSPRGLGLFGLALIGLSAGAF